MFTTGAFFGAGFAGPSGDYLGRRKTISLGCLLFCLGGGLQTGAKTLPYLYSGRFFAGLGYISLVYGVQKANLITNIVQCRLSHHGYSTVPS